MATNYVIPTNTPNIITPDAPAELATSTGKATMLDAALSYAQRGWRILPVWSVANGVCGCRKGADCDQKPGKHPVTANGLNDATSDEKTIRTWWSMYPNANIGVALEASGLMAIDVDEYRQDHEKLADAENSYGELPPTLRQTSGSGAGSHYVFRDPGVETRGEVNGITLRRKNYIVLAPSVHASGGAYAWDAGCGPDDIEAASLPPKWIDAVRKDNGEAKTTNPDADIMEGGRNIALTALAGALREKGLGVDAIAAALLAENARRCKLPLPEHEVRGIAESIGRYPAGPDVAGGAAFASAMGAATDKGRTGPEAKPALTYGADSIDFIGDGEGVDDDKDAWLVEGMLPAGLPSMIVGLPKCRKTFWMYYQAICVAAGKRVLGLSTTRAKVLVISREDGVRETRRRLWQLARGADVDLKALVTEGWLRVDAHQPLRFDNPDDVRKLRTTIEEFGPGLILIDSLSRVHCADENDKTAMSVVTNAWSDLCQEYSCAVCILHHTVKWDGGGDLIQKIRGTGDLGALVRVAVGVEKVKRTTDQSAFAVDGNMADMATGFRVRFVDKLDARGNKTIRLETVLAIAEGTSEETDPLTTAEMSSLMTRMAKGDDVPTKEMRKAIGGSRKHADETIALAKAKELIEVVMRGKKHMGCRITSKGWEFEKGGP